MWQRQDDLDLTVMAVSFEPPEQTVLPLAGGQRAAPVFLDQGRRLYHYYGMHGASFWDLWGLKTWLVYLRLLLKGRRLQKSSGDIYQRGGDVLIDPGGIIRLHHIGTGPADRPDPQKIAAVIRAWQPDPAAPLPR